MSPIWPTLLTMNEILIASYMASVGHNQLLLCFIVVLLNIIQLRIFEAID